MKQIKSLSGKKTIEIIFLIPTEARGQPCWQRVLGLCATCTLPWTLGTVIKITMLCSRQYSYYFTAEERRVRGFKLFGQHYITGKEFSGHDALVHLIPTPGIFQHLERLSLTFLILFSIPFYFLPN